MFIRWIKSIILACTLLHVVSQASGCPLGYTLHDPLNACFKAYSQAKTYHQARDVCAADGGLLAMPKTSSLNNFVMNLMNELDPGAEYWLGLNDLGTEGVWLWEDGTPHASNDWGNWGAGEPNNLGGGEHCALKRRNGDWNDWPCPGTYYYKFVCQVQWRVQCPALPAPVNGAMTGANNVDGVVTFTCNVGYELDGSPSLTCQADLTWDGSVPTCPRVQCPTPPAPVNGYLSGGNFYQDVVQFTCHGGYELVGRPSLICQVDATWNGAVPTCTRIQCPILPSPINGNSNGRNFYQDVVQFWCDPGYEPMGQSSSTCQGDRTWSSNVPLCNDVDECSAAVAGCDQVCANTIGSFQCSCVGGFNLNTNGLSCDDINECMLANGGCQQNCHNIIGSYWCTCGTGYTLNVDGLTCSDVDECFAARGGCDQLCTNTVGSFLCSCGDGYSLNDDGFYCDDVNECETANGGCGQICDNLIGSFQCSCGDGYALNSDGLACDDLDECVYANGGCEQLCTNIPGSFQCSCGPGYNLSGNGFSCDDVDECMSLNGGCEQTCTNTTGSFQCSCLVGFSLSSDGFTCDDVDECTNANGGCDQNCTNSIGSFQCSCETGYSLNADGFSCDDINECTTENGGCEQMCNNTIGSFQCSCHIGYVLNIDGLTCEDIDECNTTNGGCAQICNNTIGSFECLCRTGYILNINGLTCDDIDECDTANGDCGQFCNNTLGGYNCYCASGYSLAVDQFACDGFDPASNLSCSFTTTTSISLTWTKPAADIRGIYQPSLMTSFQSRNDTSAVISSLYSGVQYSFTVLAFGLWNDSANASVTCITELPPPTNFSVSRVGAKSVTVRWLLPARALVVGYKVWVTDKETTVVTSIQYVPTSAVSATFTSLIPATEYLVAGTCVNSHIAGPQADVIAVTDTDGPRDLIIEDVKPSSLFLSWVSPVAKLTGYELTYGSFMVVSDNREPPVTTEDGNQAAEAPRNLRTRSVPAHTCHKTTDPPTELTVRDASATWMYVMWTPPVAAVVAYDLKVIDTISQEEIHFSIPYTIMEFNITGLFPKTKYVVRIAAVSMYGRSVEDGSFGSTVAMSVDNTDTDALSSKATTMAPADNTIKVTAFWLKNVATTPQTSESTPELDPFMPGLLETTTSITTVQHSDGGEQQSAELKLTPIEEEEAIDLLSKSSELIRATQGSTITTMEKINDAIATTVSSLVQMTLTQNYTTVDDSVDLFEMDVIDVHSVDVSPKQQLKNIRDQQLTSQLQRRGAALSLMDSIDQAANSLLDILPHMEDYATTFHKDEIAVVIARSTKNSNVTLQAGQVTVSASTTNCSSDDSADVKLIVTIPLTWETVVGRQYTAGNAFDEYGSNLDDAAASKKNGTMDLHAFDVHSSTPSHDAFVLVGSRSDLPGVLSLRHPSNTVAV
ncbi:hypothetical protein Bbelb_430440 [Branchiostoma belcheri]|nr:hypothetical protein Bbelb_430440 [Branchiostoma belcheri]